ncbi:MAG: aspartate-semialdehyde dehydrogenase [Deltaproteobacteria bacterium]|nr:MAG: aspartate-semialdehyde dehydrogenase [Deltaproteobacteria bacterium]
MARERVGIVGATGAVGEEIMAVLEERRFPVSELRLFASKRSIGTRLEFLGEEVAVEQLDAARFRGLDIVFFTAGAAISRTFVPKAVAAGAVAIDNSSAFRMEREVPLVVPEVNAHRLETHQGIIANPNCSTIQLVVVLKPIHDAAQIRRVVVSTYQATSGKGKRAMDELARQTANLLNARPIECRIFPKQIAFNCLPHIDDFDEAGNTMEERKIVQETKKILEDDSVAVTATAVRVPVFNGHSEAVNIEMAKKLTADEVRRLLREAPGIIVEDDPKALVYPTNVACGEQDAVFVGRIREDPTLPAGLNLWIVADNLRKGAALNAVEIAELLP